MNRGGTLFMQYMATDAVSTGPLSNPQDLSWPQGANGVTIFTPDQRLNPIPLPTGTINQFTLYWFLATMPDMATFVDIIPVSGTVSTANPSGTIKPLFVDMLNLLGPAGPIPGSNIVVYPRQFNEYDNTNSLVLPHAYRIHKTGVDNSSVATGQGYSLAIGSQHELGTSDAWPFLVVLSDGVPNGGTDNTGAMAVGVRLTWS